jgi:hypothetical protein
MMKFFLEIYNNVVLTQSPRSFFILSAISLLLYRIPLIDKILRTFHTLIHESGHAFASLLTGGKNHRMELKTNLSGLTITESRSKFRQFIVALAGYPFASATGFLGFFLLLNDKAGIFHILLLSVAAFQLLLNIRNSYGIIWAILVCTLLLLEIVKLPQLMWSTGVIICTVILFESVIMAAHIFILSFRKPLLSGDAANLHKITGIHSVFWGTLFFAQSVVFMFYSGKLILSWADIIS